jgi:hypothetical protein
MRSEVYETLAKGLSSALDNDIRGLPNEHEPDGFVERVRPLELTSGILVASGCSGCGVQILANNTKVACACGRVVSLR